MKKYNKHFLERDPSSQVVLVEDGKPILGKIAKKDCPLEDWQVKTLNKSWKNTGIYYAPIAEEKATKVEKSESRLELEAEAKELGISFRDNIGDEKLQEKINKKLEE